MKYNSDLNRPFGLAVSMGLVPSHSTISKFGENPEIDSGGAAEDVWEFGGSYIYDADGTAPIQYVSTGSTSDTGQSIQVQGLDINGNFVKQTVITTGQTNVVLDTPLWRVFRISNESSDTDPLIGILYVHIDAAPTVGVPTVANTRATVSPGKEQTQMCLYTIPKGKVAFLNELRIGLSRSTTAGTADCSIYQRKYGKLLQNKGRINISNSGNSIFEKVYNVPSKIASLTDIKVTVESVSANDTGVFATFDILLVDEGMFPASYLASLGQPGY